MRIKGKEPCLWQSKTETMDTALRSSFPAQGLRLTLSATKAAKQNKPKKGVKKRARKRTLDILELELETVASYLM